MKSILSTKKLSDSQREIFIETGIKIVDYDAIEIINIDFKVPKKLENAIFTSQNAVKSFFQEKSRLKKNNFKCFCVGHKTMQLLVENGQNMVKMTKNASELANFIVKNYKNEAFYFFCGNLRRDEIPSALKNAKIALFEVKTYKTVLKQLKFDQKWDGILFFSPSGVESFLSENNIGNSLAICIGETTASEAQKHTNNIIVSEETTIDSVLNEVLKFTK